MAGIAFALIAGLLPLQVKAFSGHGFGRQFGPYRINSCEQLQEMKDDLDGEYVLENDIDCSATSSWNSGAGFLPIGNLSESFTGSFDGRNFTIDGLYINRPAEQRVGLFGVVYQAEIKNTALTGASVAGEHIEGILAGIANETVFSRVQVEGEVTGGSLTAGLVGLLGQSSSINGAVVNAAVHGSGTYVGGMAAVVMDSSVTNVNADVVVTNDAGHAGGITASASAGDADTTFGNILVKGSISAPGQKAGVAGMVETTSHTLAFSSIGVHTTGVDYAIYAFKNTVTTPIQVNDAFFSIEGESEYPTFCAVDPIDGCIDYNIGSSDSGWFENQFFAPFDTWNFTDMWEDSPNFLSLRPAILDTLGALSVPSNPSIATTVTGIDNIDISWSLPSEEFWGGDPLLLTKVEFKLSSSGDWTEVDLNADQTSYSITELTPGESYDIRLSVSNQQGFGSYGTQENIIIANPNISTCEDLQNMSANPNGDYILTQDIDCSATAISDDQDPNYNANLYNDGEGFIPVEDFTGTLSGENVEGADFTISELTINRPLGIDQGLFGSTFSGAYIHDLHLSGVYVGGGLNAGGLIGSMNADSVVENVVIGGVVLGVDSVGMVAGSASSVDGNAPLFSNITTSGSLEVVDASSGTHFGGIAGYLYSGESGEFDIITIESSVSTPFDYPIHKLGGLFGRVDITGSTTVSIQDSLVLGQLNGSDGVGGVAGEYAGTDNGNSPELHSDGVTVFSSIYANSSGGGLVGTMTSNGGAMLYLSDSVYNSLNENDGGLYVTDDFSGAGGLVGTSYQDANGGIEVDQSYVSADINNSSSNETDAGGLFGHMEIPQYVTSSYADVYILASGKVGGIAGYSAGTSLQDSYTAGYYFAPYDDAGGLFGRLDGGFVANSFTSSSAYSDSGTGGALLGSAPITSMIENSQISNLWYDQYESASSDCYFDTDTSQYISDETCTAVNFNEEGTPSDPNYFKENTANPPLDGWDFNDVWAISEDDFPVLQVNPERSPIIEIDYTIDDCQDLQSMRRDLGGSFSVVNNIDCTDTQMYNNGDGFEPVGNESEPFTGNLDGNGYWIYAPNIDRPDQDFIGLFGVTSNAVISDFTYSSDASSIGFTKVGSIVGQMNNGILNDVTNRVPVIGAGKAGGLIGQLNCADAGTAEIVNVVNYSSVFISDNAAGGIVGELNNSHDDCSVVIRNSKNKSYVGYNWESPGDNMSGIGGIIGMVNSEGGAIEISFVANDGFVGGSDYNVSAVGVGGIIGTQSTLIGKAIPQIIRASNDEEVFMPGNESESTGGIVGLVYGGANIQRSVNRVQVAGFIEVGGIVGSLYSEGQSNDIFESYSTGDIEVNDVEEGTAWVGGLVGYGFQARIKDSYSTGNTATNSAEYVGGLAGEIQGDVISSYATGNVSGGNYIGGLIGRYQSSETQENIGLYKNFATGLVSGNDIYQSGLVGYLNTLTATINQNFYDEYTSGQANCFSDLYGDSFTFTNSCDRRNSENSQPDYFKDNTSNAPFVVPEDGWDFDSIWVAAISNYPRLRWDYIRPSLSITNCEQLQAMRFAPDADYTLDGPIDCSDTVNWNGGAGFRPIGSYTEGDANRFTGSLNGHGYSINDLYMDSDESISGVFGEAENASLQNFAISGEISVQNSRSGGIVGRMTGGTLINIEANLDFTSHSSRSGGIVGSARCEGADQPVFIVNVANSGTITIKDDNWGTGGLVGQLSSEDYDCTVLVQDVLFTGSIEYEGNSAQPDGTQIGPNEVGGIIGEISNTAGNVELNGATSDAIINNVQWAGGGLIGLIDNDSGNDASTVISFSQSNSTIIGIEDSYRIGGLIGFMNGGNITDSYSNSLVAGCRQIGGLVGELEGGGYAHIERAFAEGIVVGDNCSENEIVENIGGLVGNASYTRLVDTYTDVLIDAEGVNIGGIAGQLYGDIVNSYASGYFGMESVAGNTGGIVGVYVGTPTAEEDGILHSFSGMEFSFDPGELAGVGGIFGYSDQAQPPNNLATNIFDVANGPSNACGFIYPIDPLTADDENCQVTELPSLWNTTNQAPFRSNDAQNWDFELIWETRENDLPVLRLAGPAATPKYEIETCEDLQNINYDLDGNYILLNDIDCSSSDELNNGDGFSPIGRGEGTVFSGELDGQGYAIKSLYIYSWSDADNVGIFGQVENAGIHDITLDGYVEGSSAVGGLIGLDIGGTSIDRVGNYMNIYATNDFSGGLVGKSESGIEIQDSYNQGLIEGSRYSGGILGYTEDFADIYRSYNSGEVYGMGDVGGIAGIVAFGTIDSTFNAGYVQATNEYAAIVSNVGEVYFTNNFVDWERTGDNNCIGNVGNEECSLVNGENTAPNYFFDNHSNAPFDLEGEANWDFDTVWHTNRNSYPTLGAREDYLIHDCEELQGMSDMNGYYTLANSFACGDVNSPIAENEPFRGVLDGNGHTISDFTVYSGYNKALFGFVENAEFRDLYISNYSSLGAGCGSPLVGQADGVDIYNVHTTGSFSAHISGGLVACINSQTGNQNTIEKSSFNGELDGTNSGGGLVGEAELNSGSSLYITDSRTFGSLTGSSCGGLVALTNYDYDAANGRDGVAINTSWSEMDINCATSAGGLVARVNANGLDMEINQSHFKGSIIGNDANFIGGLIGRYQGNGHTPSLIIRTSFTEANITDAGADVGGLVGLIDNGVYTFINNTYFNGDIEMNNNRGGGLIGSIETAPDMFEMNNSYASGSIVSTGMDDMSPPWTGGLIGFLQFGGIISNSFAAMEVAVPDFMPFAGSGFIGYAPSEDTHYLNDYFNSDTASGYCADGDIDFVVDSECNPVSLNEYPDIWKESADDNPLYSWDFAETWHVRADDYPNLRPIQTPEINCYQITRTSTTADVNCFVNPVGWGIATWEMQFQIIPDGTMTDVVLPNERRAIATLTGLTPNTDYRVLFRFSNDWGTSDWGHIDFSTLSNSSGGSDSSNDGSTNGGGSGASVKKAVATFAVSKPVAQIANQNVVSKQKIMLNDFPEFTNGEGKKVQLKVGQVVFFKVDGQEHSATVKEIGIDYVILTLRSTPFDVRINLGQTGTFDVNEDNVNDIQITLSSIHDGIADLTFRDITSALKLPASSEDIAKGDQFNWLLWVLIAGAILFMIIVILKKNSSDNKG